jgi:hypothetical protein
VAELSSHLTWITEGKIALVERANLLAHVAAKDLAAYACTDVRWNLRMILDRMVRQTASCIDDPG